MAKSQMDRALRELKEDLEAKTRKPPLPKKKKAAKRKVDQVTGEVTEEAQNPTKELVYQARNNPVIQDLAMALHLQQVYWEERHTHEASRGDCQGCKVSQAVKQLLARHFRFET